MAASELDLERVEQAWPTVAPWLRVPRTEAEYQQLVAVLNALIDRVGEDETHPLASLMDVVGELIAQYEDAHVPELA
jgi:HTH-type transcriptional regulator / antitoxin HigA